MKPSHSIFLIILIGLIVYSTSLFNQFILDDHEMIVNNQVIHSFSNFPKFLFGGVFSRGETERLTDIYYRPVLPITFSLTYSIFGPNPFMFHLLKLFLHILTAILLFLLLKRFLQPKIGLLLSLIFVVHSGISEAVFYASSISDMLFVLFGITAQLLIITSNSFKSLIGVAVFLTLALFSKETGLFFLPLSLLASWFFNKKIFIRVLISCLFVVCVYGFFRFQIAHMPFLTTRINPIMEASFGERLWTAPAVIWYYIKTIFFPKNIATSQHWLISYPTLTNFYTPLIIVSSFLGLLIAYLVYLYKTKHKYLKVYLFFFLWFLLGFALNSHIIYPLSSTVADRWLYFPLVGFLGMTGIIVSIIKINNTFLKQLGITIIIIIIILLSIRTIVRSFDWRNGYTLGCHDLNVAPPSFELEAICGTELLNKKQYDEAKIHLEKSVQLEPYGINLNNLATLYLFKNDKNKAIELFNEAINKYHYYKAYENLASILLFENKPQEAKKVVAKALKRFPSNTKLWYILALAEYKMGNKENALYSAKIYAKLNGTKESSNLYWLIKNNTPFEQLINK